MLNRYLLLIAFFLPVCGAFAQQQPVSKPERTTYAIKGNDTLWFERYSPRVQPNGISVLFVHGGAFTGGDPANQHPMGNGLAALGYNVFVIKYRLYLKGKSFGCTTPTGEKLKAIRYAVEDAMDATAYLANHAGELGVDTSRLFISGSSAGAEAILNVVYNPFAANRFHYAGLMSFAGAIVDMNKVTKENWIPALLMHGTRDQLVPFGTAAHRFCRATDEGWLMLSGSGSVFEFAKSNKLPAALYTYEGGGHEVSNYMFKRFEEMDAFMKQAVSGKRMNAKEIRKPKG
jgi:acetyl esterase/lipase